MSKLDSGGSFSEQKKQQRQKRAVKATHLLFWPIREKANFWTKNPTRPEKAVRGCSSFEFEMWIKERSRRCTKILLCPSWTNTIENMGNCPRVHSPLVVVSNRDFPSSLLQWCSRWMNKSMLFFSKLFFFFDQSASFAFLRNPRGACKLGQSCILAESLMSRTKCILCPSWSNLHQYAYTKNYFLPIFIL